MNISQLFSFKLTKLQKLFYLFFIFCSVFIFCFGLACDNQRTIIHWTFFVFSFSLLPFFFFLCLNASKYLNYCSIIFTNELSNKQKFPIFLFLFLILIYFVFSLCLSRTCWDTNYQWEQALSGRINDWHPATHTFLMWLSSCIYPKHWFFIFLQSVIYAYLICEAGKILVNKLCIKKSFVFVTMILLSFLPKILYYLMMAWKDTAMMIAFWALSCVLIKISVSKGEWLNHYGNIIIFSIVLTISTLLRHNAFFYTFPLVIFLFLVISRKYLKKYFILLFVFLLLYIPIKFVAIPFFCADNLPVGGKNQTFIEAIGVPLTIMGRIYYIEQNKEKLPPEFIKLMKGLGSEKSWQKYEGQGINTVKFLDVERFQYALEQTTPRAFFPMFFKIVKQYPQECLSGFIINYVWPWLPTSWPGVGVYLLLFTGIITFPYIKWQILPFVIPTLAYNVGTTLLLFGDEFRYFAYIFATTLPNILIMLFLALKSTKSSEKSSQSQNQSA